MVLLCPAQGPWASSFSEEADLKMILSGNCPPLLFENVIDHWPARQWTIENLAKRFPDLSFLCKVSSRISRSKLI